MSYFKKFYNYCWLHESSSAFFLLFQKITLGLGGVIYTLYFRRNLIKTRRLLAEKRIENKGKKVFVFANGPSLGAIDLEKIKRLQTQGHSLIAINSFVSKSASIIRPDYVVFADKLHFGLKASESTQYAEDVSWCIQNGVKIFLPAHYAHLLRGGDSYSFNGFVNIFSGNVTDISKPLGYYPLTGLYALSLAVNLGFSEIYMAGFDNSYFKEFEVTDGSALLLKHTHYYDEKGGDTVVKKEWMPTSKLFFDFYRHFGFIEKITASFPGFINVSRVTYLLSVRRRLDLDIYYDDRSE